MKTWIAKFYRHNPQLKTGGYETTVTIMAKNKRECTKQIKSWLNPVYGSMELISLKEKSECNERKV